MSRPNYGLRVCRVVEPRRVPGPEPSPGPGVAARLLSLARARADLSQSEIARRSGVRRETVNRIERGAISPPVDLLAALLAACDVSLTLEPRLGHAVGRGAIRTLLQAPPSQRVGRDQRRALRLLATRAMTFIVVGRTAARLNGAPVVASLVEVLVRPDEPNRRRLAGAVSLPLVGSLVSPTLGWDPRLWRTSWVLSVVDRPITPREIRVASVDDLIGAASDEEAPLLHALRTELDGG